VLQRHLAGQQVRFEPVDRVWLAALLHPLPRPILRRLRLLVRPDTVLRWHRDLLARRLAAVSRPRRRGRPCTLRSKRMSAAAGQAPARRAPKVLSTAIIGSVFR
jgi:putative transposase